MGGEGGVEKWRKTKRGRRGGEEEGRIVEEKGEDEDRDEEGKRKRRVVGGGEGSIYVIHGRFNSRAEPT